MSYLSGPSGLTRSRLNSFCDRILVAKRLFNISLVKNSTFNEQINIFYLEMNKNSSFS